MKHGEDYRYLVHPTVVLIVDILLVLMLFRAVKVIVLSVLLPPISSSSLWALEITALLVLVGVPVHELCHYVVATAFRLRPRFGRHFWVLPTSVSYRETVPVHKFVAIALSPIVIGLLTMSMAGILYLFFPSIYSRFIWGIVVSLSLVAVMGASHDVMWVYAALRRNWMLIEEHPQGNAFRPAGTTTWWMTQPPRSIQRLWKAIRALLRADREEKDP